MSSKGRRTVVELGTDRVKLVQFSVHPHGVSISKLHVCVAPEEGALAESLTEAVEAQGFDVTHVVGCLPRHMVNVRMFDLPSVDLAEIAGMVDLQFGKQVPYSRDEVVADYRVLGTPRDGYMRVILVVIQRGPLRECFNLLDAAGLNVETMTISSDGIAQWAAGRPAAAEGKAEAVLDIDSGHADLVVQADGELCYTRSILVGSEQLAEGDRWSEKLVSEARQALEILRGEQPDMDVAKVLVTGCDRVPDALVAALGEALQVPVERVSLSESLQDDPAGLDESDVPYQEVSLTALAGVARDTDKIAFKLFPASTLMVRAMVSRAKGLALLGVLIVTALFSGSFYGISKYTMRSAQADDVHAEYERSLPAVRGVMQMQAVVNAVAARQDAHFAAVSLFEAVHAAVPEDVFFDSVDIDLNQGEVRLGGAGPTTREVRELINNLKESPLLTDVKQSGSTTKDPRSNRYRFQIIGKFERESANGE